LRKVLFSLILILLYSGLLQAKLKTAVVHLCFEKDDKPFMVSTTDSDLAKENGFLEYKNSGKYLLKMKMLIDSEPFVKFRPLNESCLTLFKVPPGHHTISVDFKTVSYTKLIPLSEVSMRFKADLLYKEKIVVGDGASATLVISQEKNKVVPFQTVDNTPIQNCSKKCEIPAETPIYFMTKSNEEKVICPIKYEVILSSDESTVQECYSDERIKIQLKNFVEKNSLQCKAGVEYAFFKVYGEGCILTLEPDKSGLRAKDPVIKLIPLDKQKLKYFISINGKTRELYPFAQDLKGKIITPKSGDKIEFIEDQN